MDGDEPGEDLVVDHPLHDLDAVPLEWVEVLLVPLGLVALVVAFFYFTSPRKAGKKATQSFDWIAESPAEDETPRTEDVD